MKVYLAQSMHGYDKQSYFVSKLKSLLLAAGHTVYDPYDFEVAEYTDADLVALDLGLLDKSDIMVAYLQRPSNGGGTYGELYHAAFSGKPVIFVAPTRMYGPWMRHFTTAYVDTSRQSLDSSVSYTLALLNRHFKPRLIRTTEKVRL